MQFEYSPARVRETRSGPRFRIGRLTERTGQIARDVTGLVDRTYDYASQRELHWHLAERFGIAPNRLVLARR